MICLSSLIILLKYLFIFYFYFAKAGVWQMLHHQKALLFY